MSSVSRYKYAWVAVTTTESNPLPVVSAQAAAAVVNNWPMETPLLMLQQYPDVTYCI